MHFVPTPSGGQRLQGLDYARARSGWAMAGVEMTPELFAQVRLIEAGAIKASAG